MTQIDPKFTSNLPLLVIDGYVLTDGLCLQVEKEDSGVSIEEIVETASEVSEADDLDAYEQAVMDEPEPEPEPEPEQLLPEDVADLPAELTRTTSDSPRSVAAKNVEALKREESSIGETQTSCSIVFQ